jgi:hypothetical protein
MTIIGLYSPPPDAYADAVAPESTAVVIDANNAIGAPDGRFAQVSGMFGGRTLVLDLGAGEDGVGSLDLYSSNLNRTFANEIRVDLVTGGGTLVLSRTVNLIGLGSHTTTVQNASTKPYRYVRIYAYQSQVFGVDAVRAAGGPA